MANYEPSYSVPDEDDDPQVEGGREGEGGREEERKRERRKEREEARCRCRCRGRKVKDRRKGLMVKNVKKNAFDVIIYMLSTRSLLNSSFMAHSV